MKAKITINEADLSNKDFLNKTTRKRDEKNKFFYEVYKKQYSDWKNILIQELKLSNNKCILTYIMFITVEVYIKAELIKTFNIDDMHRSVKEISYKSTKKNFVLGQIDHDLNSFFKFIDDNQDNPMLKNLIKLLIIRDKIELLELGDKITNDYMSLRYNYNKQGDLLIENNVLEKEYKEKIEEVIKYVI